ncbi:MAG: hypothetical protein AAFR30_11200, partial [Cyanobacteria bacterium J06628_4]
VCYKALSLHHLIICVLFKTLSGNFTSAGQRDRVTQSVASAYVIPSPDLDQLAPSQVATCGEVAAMVYQGLVLHKRMPPIASPYRVVLPT